MAITFEETVQTVLTLVKTIEQQKVYIAQLEERLKTFEAPKEGK